QGRQLQRHPLAAAPLHAARRRTRGLAPNWCNAPASQVETTRQPTASLTPVHLPAGERLVHLTDGGGRKGPAGAPGHRTHLAPGPPPPPADPCHRPTARPCNAMAAERNTSWSCSDDGSSGVCVCTCLSQRPGVCPSS